MFSQKKVVLLSLLFLLVAIGLVYKFFLDSSGKEIYEQLRNGTKNVQQVVKVDDNDSIKENVIASDNEAILISGHSNIIDVSDDDGEDLSDINVILSGGLSTGELLEIDSDPVMSDGTDAKLILSGTLIYDSNLEILELLDIKYDYILTDEYDNKFVYLGTGSFMNYTDIEIIGGNSVEIKDKISINDNLLIGDELIFINLPDYKDKLVNFVVKFKKSGDLWLVQTDYSKYYKMKPYFKKIFRYIN